MFGEGLLLRLGFVVSVDDDVSLGRAYWAKPPRHQPIQSCHKGRGILRYFAIKDPRLLEQQRGEIVHFCFARIFLRAGDGSYERVARI